jgi:hypothetical protein
MMVIRGKTPQKPPARRENWMKEPEDDRRSEVALQRYEVISPLLNRPLPRGVQEIMIDEISGILHYDVDGNLIALGKRTIERYLSNYLKFGLEGLKPQVRPEQGSLKSFPREVICGSGQGSGGGYDSPCPYRTKSQIYDFFKRAGVTPQGVSSTRKWFTLESLQLINGNGYLEQVILRLVSPKEYRGEAETIHQIVDHLNRVLQAEGLEIVLIGVEPQIRTRAATITPPRPKEKPIETSPDFIRLVQSSSLADILSLRWMEAQRCVKAGAHLAAVVMMGSILEGVLLYKVEQNPKEANQAKCVPKDRDGKPKAIYDWSLSSLVDVANEVGWLQGDVKRFSHALRESRNIVHPYVQRLRDERPDEDTCSICWQVIRAAVADLLNID